MVSVQIGYIRLSKIIIDLMEVLAIKSFKTYLWCLGIEVTRRCNLKCKFCARGDSQNKNISKDVIDKVLDELKGTYIETLRITGGEPFLVPEIIEYLIDKIIEQHIYIGRICIFTNGTKFSPELVGAFKRLLNHLRNIEQEIPQLIRWSCDRHRSIYRGIAHTKIAIIVSEFGHTQTQTQIDEFMTLCNQINDDDLGVVKQTWSFEDGKNITLEGNAKKNYKELLTEPISLGDIRILDNKYSLIKTLSTAPNERFLHNMNYVAKTLTVSVNGNVFPGCMMEYDRVDSEYMFNIFELNGDLFPRVEDYCWKNPICQEANRIRCMYKAYKFCCEHELQHNVSREDSEKLRIFDRMINDYETTIKDIHPMLPTLSLLETSTTAMVICALQMLEYGINEYVGEFLAYCTDFPKEQIREINKEWCRGFILYMIEEDKERRKKQGLPISNDEKYERLLNGKKS